MEGVHGNMHVNGKKSSASHFTSKNEHAESGLLLCKHKH